MLTDLQRDILIKSAEGIQEGMWCKGKWFAPQRTSDGAGFSEEGEYCDNVSLLFESKVTSAALSYAASSYRCVEGEIAYRTFLLGGNEVDYEILIDVVTEAVRAKCERCEGRDEDLWNHNDQCMDDYDAFTAGVEWATTFRSLL